jgi:hypothetical protein
MILLASAASAAITRPYAEVSFGPDGIGGTEAFSSLGGIAVDQSTGDLYAFDVAGGGKLYKFNASGEPLAFSALGGSHVIEGISNEGVPTRIEIAVAPENALGGTAGNIYIATGGSLGNRVTVFASTGAEIGTLGKGGNCGVAVDPAGKVFISAQPSEITEYAPTTNPPSESDLTNTGRAPDEGAWCNVAVDGAGNIYEVTSLGKPSLVRLEGISDTRPTVITPGAVKVAIDPLSDELYADRGEKVAIYGPDASVLGTFGEGWITDSHGVAIDHGLDRVYVDDGVGNIKVFGSPETVPDVSTGVATHLTPFSARLAGSVNPDGLAINKCFFEYGETTAYGQTTPCEEPEAAEIGSGSVPVEVHANVTGLSKLVTYHFRLVAENENGRTETDDESFTTTSAAGTEPAAPVGPASAILRGTVFPEGVPYSNCEFEYGVSGIQGFKGSVPCDPPASAIPPDALAEPVSASIVGLQQNTTYRFRLVLTDASGTVVGKALTFTTAGTPLLTAVRASAADQNSATLEANIDPQGSATSYAFEWGPTQSYGNRVSVPPGGSVGSGTLSVHVSSRISGLAPGSSYHYRVVASNGAGSSESPDSTVETLNSCGLPEGRCFELVSPRAAGPVDLPGLFAGNVELHFQAANIQGKLAYVSEIGPPEATKGAEVLSEASRGLDRWSSGQLSPAISDVIENRGSTASSKYFALNEELTCGIVASNQPLTSDPGTWAAREAGGGSLYRQNRDGSFTAITALAPENPEVVGTASITNLFGVDAVSQNCGKVLFRAPYRYPGIPAVLGTNGVSYAYEWDEGTLRGAGYIPGSSGEVLAPTTMGPRPGAGFPYNYNGVSADGSRVFFVANRLVSPNPDEVDAPGIFVRESGAGARDISLSETSVPDADAKFEFATKDGRHMYFTARAGLTAKSNSSGRDLYEYDLARNQLVDLVAVEGEEGASVAGFIGASEDGSRVYLSAGAQLVPGKGRTLAQNESAGTFSIYGEENGEFSYVGMVDANEMGRLGPGPSQTARVSPDGRFLLFESSANLVGYDSGNDVPEAYLYDSEASTDPTVCISCRQDGRPSVSPPDNRRMATTEYPTNSIAPPRVLAYRGGAPVVFFNQFDALAPGAVEGGSNVYEWTHGQVFLVAAEPPGLQPPESSVGTNQEGAAFVGASEDATDLYFRTPQTMTWEDGDGRMSIYDARIGGGYPEPPPPTAPCRPVEEDSCQGVGQGPPGMPSAASQSFNGPGNPKPKKHHKKKHHKKKHHKKKHHKKKHHGASRNGKADK